MTRPFILHNSYDAFLYIIFVWHLYKLCPLPYVCSCDVFALIVSLSQSLPAFHFTLSLVHFTYHHLLSPCAFLPAFHVLIASDIAISACRTFITGSSVSLNRHYVPPNDDCHSHICIRLRIRLIRREGNYRQAVVTILLVTFRNYPLTARQ